ncbi:MAG: SDR family NAD(P)-dependent oxidoreductase, partial [Lachnospiraceae bacterium]|nr:SDR family NAD(P)-dependent oxidoreductase [Lachnospiraceae bacterium]
MEDQLFSVRDRVCIVTGGFGQLGFQYVKALHERGAKVAVFGRHAGPDKIEKVFGGIKDDNLRFYQVDIVKKEDLEKALDDIESVWGSPDVLVNNAG